MAENQFTAKLLTGLDGIEPAVWDACANPAAAKESNPFVSHAFLSAFEQAGCVGGRSGWTPRHIVLERAGSAVAAAPAYLKSHSMGEYVFDHSWADAYERAGGRYYPKLQLAVPFSPVPGPRLLIKPGPDEGLARTAMAEAIIAVTNHTEASSAHVTFMPEQDWRSLGACGFLLRQDQQFHWHNRGYENFDAFLADLASRKRKMIAKERRAAVEPGITIKRLTGSELREAHWDAFFSFYMDTSSRKWGRPYLNRRFFSLLNASLAEQILLVLAFRNGRPIAGALNMIGSHALFGRNWGAVEHHPFLHFELCYYQAIEFAIERKLARVEAGAQGEHKLARGYLPAATYSAHYIADQRLQRAVSHYLEEERRAVNEMMETLTEMGPFRKGIAEMDM